MIIFPIRRRSRALSRKIRPAAVRPALRPFFNLQRLEDRVQPATFVVSNTLDAGVGSFRDAVLKANLASGADVIDLTGVSGTISLLSALPAVTDIVTVNGPGSSNL